MSPQNNPQVVQNVAPALCKRCENHPESPAKWVLAQRELCDWCAEQTLVVAEFGATPVQLPLIASALHQVRASSVWFPRRAS